MNTGPPCSSHRNIRCGQCPSEPCFSCLPEIRCFPFSFCLKYFLNSLTTSSSTGELFKKCVVSLPSICAFPSYLVVTDELDSMEVRPYALCDHNPGNATQARSMAHMSSATASRPRAHGRNHCRQLLGVMFQEELWGKGSRIVAQIFCVFTTKRGRPDRRP